jgi:catechol 2,3-dioxygenase
MSDSTWGMVGGVGGEAATEGSYGERPRGFRLPAATRLGPVSLQVRELERSVAFYRDGLGLQVIELEAGRASLGAHGDERTLVRLEARRAGTAVQRSSRLGLFHFAILLADRGALGRFARHMAASGIPLGAGDHLVSEALYLQDPDGLGIEVYADRPRNEWRRVGRELRIGTEPLDVASLLTAAGGEPWAGMPTGTVVGHVHLRVGDLRQAAAFFSDALGFDVMTWSYPGALFFGAGGYHHHLGTNVWDREAEQAAADEPRLLEWTVEVPDAASVEAAGRSLAAAGYPATREQDAIIARDPWGTAIRVRAVRD